MKRLISLAPMLLVFGSMVAMGAPHAKKKALKPADAPKLGTSFRFDGTSLHGKYATSPSLTSTVENDKYMDDLLGAPKSFNDRVARDSERN